MTEAWKTLRITSFISLHIFCILVLCKTKKTSVGNVSVLWQRLQIKLLLCKYAYTSKAYTLFWNEASHPDIDFPARNIIHWCTAMVNITSIICFSHAWIFAFKGYVLLISLCICVAEEGNLYSEIFISTECYLSANEIAVT